MKRHIGFILAGVAIAAILVLYMVTFTVRWKERALVRTIGGAIVREAAAPGLHWKLPWQRVVKFDGRIRTLEQQAVQTMTKDEQNIIVTVYVNWRVKDAPKFYKSFLRGGASESEDVIAQAEEDMRGWTSSAINIFAEYKLGEMVTLEEEEFKLDTLERGASESADSLLKRLQGSVAAGGGYGIEIVDVGLRQLGVPDTVTSAVFERIKKERAAVSRTLESQGEGQAASIKGEAESEASMIRSKAEASAKSIKGEGDAKAAAYYADFLVDPDLANFLRRLDTLRETLREGATIVISSEAPPYELLIKGPEIGKSSPTTSGPPSGSSSGE